MKVCARCEFRCFRVGLCVEKKRKCGSKGVFASLFGVGASKAFVIEVVKLLIVGPKGLAEEVSSEFKSNLEKQIGLDDLKNPSQLNTSNSSESSTTLSIASPEKTHTIAMEPPRQRILKQQQQSLLPLTRHLRQSPQPSLNILRQYNHQ